MKQADNPEKDNGGIAADLDKLKTELEQLIRPEDEDADAAKGEGKYPPTK